MTPLAGILARRIAANGPLSIADYMADCLLHPDHGYYTTRDPLGVAGDFTTAPEISQMFGELVGLALAQSWLDQGAPNPFTLAELGPGRGTLMADITRATRAVPGFHAAMRLHLVEASPVLRDKQRATLAGHDVTWLDSAGDLPEAPLWLVANEFFDALPIRQFTRHAQGWCEHQVALADGALCLGLSAPAPVAMLKHRLVDTAPGDIVETCTPAAAIMQCLAARIAAHGGGAIIIDYGNWCSLGDTLQAVANHRPEPILANPGAADLTAHVDFQALAASATGIATTAMTDQGAFLHRLGIGARAARLAQGLSGAALSQHHAAFHRLTASAEMGTLFKTIALHPTGTPPPPGFAP
jgi:NADH dehydrogenase [ubiquinone] 1 alpha subcomplex assembly factor 7